MLCLRQTPPTYEQCLAPAVWFTRGAGTNIPTSELGPYQWWSPICDEHAKEFHEQIPGALVFEPINPLDSEAHTLYDQRHGNQGAHQGS